MSDVDKYRKLLNISGARPGPRVPPNADMDLNSILEGIINKDPNYDYGTLLPFRQNKKTKKSEFATPSIIKDMLRAVTAPGRAMDGSLDVNSEQGMQEAVNLTGNVQLGGLGATMATKTRGPGTLGTIKAPGGNWLTGSVEEALSHLKKREITDLQRFNMNRDATGLPRVNELPVQLETKSLNSWIDTTLNKYVKNRMATPDDEIRKLADQGITHSQVRPNSYDSATLTRYRKEFGFSEPLASSAEGRLWEDNVDTLIDSNRQPASDYLDFTTEPPSPLLNTARDNPWLSKVDPKTSIYDLKKDSLDGLGFDHLMDELSNALDPSSGLPQTLRLTPEGMGGLSMEEALRKVNGINKFRAEKAKKANARFAQAEGIPVHTDYGDGYKMLEYKKPDEPNGREQLDSWLKQEGDTMGHCVGGYCDSVESGNSRILSLRDNEGRSVATVELQGSDPLDQDTWYKLTRELEQRYPKEMKEFINDAIDNDSLPSEQLHSLISNYEKDIREIIPNIDEIMSKSSWEITQVKGPGNEKPDAKAIPYIQDFVKNSGYNVEGDLHNTDLIPAHSLTDEERALYPGEYFTIDEIKEMRKDRPFFIG